MAAVLMGDWAQFEQYRQQIVDEEDLRLLPIFYWVSGAVTAFFSLYFLVYAGIGMLFVLAPQGTSSGAEAPPPWFGWIFVGIGVAGLLTLAAVAALKIVAGFSIRDRRRRTLCLVAAGISCLELPYGTLLGILTFVTLLRPSVAALFTDGRGVPAGDAGVAR